MRVPCGKNICSISLSVLLFASILVVISNSTSNAGAEEQTLVNTATSSSSSDEVAAASGSNRFVVWADGTPGNGEIFFRRSTDNGATWQPVRNLSNNPGNSAGPLIAVSGPNVYVIWFQVNLGGGLQDVFFRRSTDNGASWGDKINLSASGTLDSIPQIAKLDDKVYVVWNQEDGEVYFRRSTDNGATWQDIVKLSNNPGDSRNPVIAASGSFVYVLWTQENAANTLSDVFFRRSTDTGATWKSVDNLSSSGNSGAPEVAASGSRVFVVWVDGAIDEQFEIVFRRSTDNGATWKSIVVLSDNPDGSGLGNQEIAVSGSSVYAVWNEEPSDILFRRSTDNGATWKSIRNLSDNEPDCVCAARAPELAVSGSNLYVVWTGHQATPLEILLARSTDGGATWKAVKNLSNNAGDAFDPQVAVSGSNAYVVWSDDTPGNLDILLKRSTDSGATWKSTKNLSNNAGVSVAPQIAI